MERYRVTRRDAIVAQIERAIESSGGRLIERADPSTAPFLMKVAGANGQILDLVCYAFTANKYGQQGRPVGEHRFQIKYGSEFDRYHDLYFDPTGHRVTLMFGVHLELGLFVAVDPRVHTPTWFSSSVEMKEADLEASRTKGWHGWERERSRGRRKVIMPEDDLRTEVVIGFRPEQFLRYVEFEVASSHLDPGERLLLSDRIEAQVLAGNAVDPRHELEVQLGLSAREVLEVIGARNRLKAAVRGGVAEHHLERYLRKVPGIRDVRQIDKDNQPDFEVGYKKRVFRIECKNVSARLVRGAPKVDFQKTRAAKGNPCSRYYKPSQFEVLAACLHPVTRQWEYRFSGTGTLPPRPDCPGHLSEHVIVAGAIWHDDLPTLLDALPS